MGGSVEGGRGYTPNLWRKRIARWPLRRPGQLRRDHFNLASLSIYNAIQSVRVSWTTWMMTADLNEIRTLDIICTRCAKLQLMIREWPSFDFDAFHPSNHGLIDQAANHGNISGVYRGVSRWEWLNAAKCSRMLIATYAFLCNDFYSENQCSNQLLK